MTASAKCKFCGVNLHLEIDDDYAGTNDRFKIIPFAACNRCADYRVERRKHLDPLARICKRLVQGVVARDDLMKVRESVETLLKRHLRLMAELRRADIPSWDPEILETVMRNPAAFAVVLKQLPAMFEQQTLLPG